MTRKDLVIAWLNDAHGMENVLIQVSACCFLLVSYFSPYRSYSLQNEDLIIIERYDSHGEKRIGR